VKRWRLPDLAIYPFAEADILENVALSMGMLTASAVAFTGDGLFLDDFNICLFVHQVMISPKVGRASRCKTSAVMPL
jgi:hypothetical protein